jgi:hypothetical protein
MAPLTVDPVALDGAGASVVAVEFGKGIGAEAGGLANDVLTYTPNRALIDPKGWSESWKELGSGMAPRVGLGGDHAPGVGQSWKDLGKGVTHWDEWQTNPAEAAGKSTFDVATLFAPGGAAGAAGKGGRAAADAAEAAGRAGKLPETAARGPGAAPKLPTDAPAPRVPRGETTPTERAPVPPQRVPPQAPEPPTPPRPPESAPGRPGPPTVSDRPASPAASDHPASPGTREHAPVASAQHPAPCGSTGHSYLQTIRSPQVRVERSLT